MSFRLPPHASFHDPSAVPNVKFQCHEQARLPRLVNDSHTAVCVYDRHVVISSWQNVTQNPHILSNEQFLHEVFRRDRACFVDRRSLFW